MKVRGGGNWAKLGSLGGFLSLVFTLKLPTSHIPVPKLVLFSPRKMPYISRFVGDFSFCFFTLTLVSV